MTALLSDPSAVWALVLVVALPVVIIGAGELQERLRQRDSDLTGVAGVVRSWVVPLVAAWAVVRGLFGLAATSLVVRVVSTALVLSGAVAVLMIVRILIARLVKRRSEDRSRVPQLLLALPRVLVILATGWVLLDLVWGVDLSAALAALGVTSLIVSFALQDTLSGLASGMLLLSDSPFQPGDWIRSGDIEGRVVDVNWRSSRIVDRNGDLLVVPNAQLAGSTIVNFDAPTRLHRVVVPVQVAYVNPPTLAKEMLLDAARSTPGVLEDPPPRAVVVQIDDPLMGYKVHLWVDDYAIAPTVAADFGALVWYQSHRHDVPLPSPAYDLYMYDGVQAGLAGEPDRAELRGRLRTSPLLDVLEEADLDRLAAAARAERFAQGERILESGEVDRDLYVLWSGSARVEVRGADEGWFSVAELSEGDVFGLLSRSERGLRPPRVRALTDCEVVVVEEAAAGEVISRAPALAGTLNQIMAMRRRRVERLVRQLGVSDGRPSGRPASDSSLLETDEG